MVVTGTTSIGSSGATGAAVSFGYTFSSVPYLVGTIGNTTSSTYALLYPFTIIKSTTGGFFEFNAATDSTNYFIDWLASDSSTIVGATGAQGSTGNTGANAVPAKPINRLNTAASISLGDYITIQTTVGGEPTTVRASLSDLKNLIDS